MNASGKALATSLLTEHYRLDLSVRECVGDLFNSLSETFRILLRHDDGDIKQLRCRYESLSARDDRSKVMNDRRKSRLHIAAMQPTTI